MANSKESAVINFLLQCPDIQDSPLYFNFINAKDNNKQLLMLANEKALNREYIDGSIQKRFTFTVIDFKSVVFNALVTDSSVSNENVDEFLQVQALIDWITERAENDNYPDFGNNCIIDEMRVLTDNPNLNGLDTSVKPALAKYSFSVQIDYLDISKAY